MHDITSNALNSNSTSGSGITYRQSLGSGTVQAMNSSGSNYGSATGTPRRSWSSYAFNNKNFPDGKLSYECTAASGQPNQQQSSPSSVYNSSASSGKQLATNSGGGGAGKQLGYGGNLSSSLAARNRFERSSQDVMARASQIVM